MSAGIAVRREPFGPAGWPVPVVGQGTWQAEASREDGVRALRRGLDLGLTHLDTAAYYGAGRAEEVVGQAIAGRRDEVFLVSKVVPDEASRRGTVAACEESLGRLGTDRLDCYLLHWLGPHPLDDTVAAFEELREAGKIRSWGVSNVDEVKLAEVQEIAGAGRIACNQLLYHLEERSIEHAVIPFCREHGIAVVGYSPFGSGSFPAPESAGGRTLAGIARERGVTPHAVALAFLVREQGLFTIPRSYDPAHLEANADGARLDLSDEEVARIDRAFPRGPRRPGVPTG